MATSSVNRLASQRENKSDKQNLITDVFAAVFILSDINNSTSVAMNIWILWVSIQNRFTHKSLYRRHYAIDYQPTENYVDKYHKSVNVNIQPQWHGRHWRRYNNLLGRRNLDMTHK